MSASASSRPSAGPQNGGREGVLEALAVVKHYGGVQALKGVTLRVEPNSVTGLIGPNGSGKTTLLNCLSGISRVTAGSVLLDGRPIESLPVHAIAQRGVARTFQSIRLF